MAAKKFSISIDPDDVVFSTISKSKNGYNSARVVVKVADQEYMSISYEWEGDSIPEFAMNLMGFMQANKVETSGVWPGKEEEYAAFLKEEDEEDPSDE